MSAPGSGPLLASPRELSLALSRGLLLALPVLLLLALALGPRSAIGAWLSVGGALAIAGLYERRALRSRLAVDRHEAAIAWFAAGVVGAVLGAVQAHFTANGLEGMRLSPTLGLAIGACVFSVVPAALLAWTVYVRLDVANREESASAIARRFAVGACWWGVIAAYPALMVGMIGPPPARGIDWLVQGVFAALVAFALGFLCVFLPSLSLFHLLRVFDWLEARLAPEQDGAA